MTKSKPGIKNANVFSDIPQEQDPIVQFTKWYLDAINCEVIQPDAMFLATAGLSGQPSGRIVLLKEVNAKGFVFFTNYLSVKGKEIELNPLVALTFHWKEIERQVRILGKASRVTREESDIYFTSRPFESKVSASISGQSSVVTDRQYLEDQFFEFFEKNKGKTIKRPDHWGGYRVNPFQIEFWQGREHRLHDRIQYRIFKNKWVMERLAP